MLEARAHSTGTTESALIRAAIDTAVSEAAGVAPYLPSGEQYVVEGIRGAEPQPMRMDELP